VIRRHSAVLAAVLALTTLSSCATFNRNDVAASVGTSKLSLQQLDDINLSKLLVAAGLKGPVSGQVPGEQARTLITVWIETAAAEQAGLLPVSDQAAIEQSVSTSSGLAKSWQDGPPELQRLLVSLTQLNQLAQAGTISREQVSAALAKVEIHVDPRYGRWDPTTAAVVPLTS
jgi:hypothetical protein